MNDMAQQQRNVDLSQGGAPGHGPAARGMGRLTPAPFTITEGLEAILEKQGEIKAALDLLIADATTLRAQM